MVNKHGVGELDFGVPWLEGAFLNQAPLKLGQGRKDVEHEFTGRRGGIDGAIAQGAKPHLPLE